MPTTTNDDLAREFEDDSAEQVHQDLYNVSIKACRDGDLESLQQILTRWRSDESVPDPRVEEELGWMLVHAAECGHVRIVRYLLDEGALIDSEVVRSAATRGSRPEIWQAFIDAGWDINSLTEDGVPVLSYLVDYEQLLQWFIEHGADPNLHGVKDQCALDQAALQCKEASVKTLLEKGADLHRSSALQIVAGSRGVGPQYISMMAFLLDRGANINALYHQGSPEYFERVKDKEPLGTALHHAARRGRKDRVQFLLDRGADPNVRDTAGRLPVDSVNVRDETGIQDLLASRTTSREGDVSTSAVGG